MTCKQVQELLPLYVGRDLEEGRAQLVTAHVQSCAECAGAADEYRETRQLLQQFAPPPFSEAVYAGIRQRVWREIGREATAPGLSRLLESLFRPRLRWAAATALLLAVSVLAFYFVANRTNGRRDGQQLAHSGGPVDGSTRDEQPNAQSQGLGVSPSPSIKESEGPRLVNTGTRTGRNTGAGTMIAGSVDRTHQSQRRKNPGVAADRTRPTTVNSADARSTNAEASPEVNSLAEPDAVPARDPATSEKTLRVEMQTKDPNIRIIWFTPQPTKQDSPDKFSKGT